MHNQLSPSRTALASPGIRLTPECVASSLCACSWLNGFNLRWALALLQRERAEAAAAIEDCRCAPMILICHSAAHFAHALHVSRCLVPM